MNHSNRTIEQLKHIFGTFSELVMIMDEKYRLLWKNRSEYSSFPDNLEAVIEKLPHEHQYNSGDHKVIVSIENKKIIGFLAPLEDFLILVIPDASPYKQNSTSPATNHYRTDNGVNKTDFVFTSNAMKKTLDLARRSSSIDATILLYGETGVGKTFLAKHIHNMSPRKRAPFVSINCGAIPFSLLESEFFGYEKGAFTGADRAGKIGLLETAIGGTVFLDEIGEISKDIQVKLLHSIEDKKIVRVGGRESIDLDIRLIAATNKDLSKMVRDGDFREDLYYRLNVISFAIPPLRERADDIVALAQYYLQVYNRKYNLNKQLGEEVMRILKEYNWPGNVRELQNSVERMIVMSERDVITERDLPVNLFSSIRCEVDRPNPERGSLQNEKDTLERELIQQSLLECSSIRKAAIKLGISHVTLLRKMEKLDMRNDKNLHIERKASNLMHEVKN
jgi:transcriptional regulator with PAS, ATPase and Fis domain